MDELGNPFGQQREGGRELQRGVPRFPGRKNWTSKRLKLTQNVSIARILPEPDEVWDRLDARQELRPRQQAVLPRPARAAIGVGLQPCPHDYC